MKIAKFEDIEAWQEARAVTNAIYDVTEKGAFAKNFGLKDQICKASVSIMANIAEGFLAQTDKQFVKYLYIALSSATEVQSHLYLTLDRKYIRKGQFEELYKQTAKVARMITGFIRYLEKSSKIRRSSDHRPLTIDHQP